MSVLKSGEMREKVGDLPGAISEYAISIILGKQSGVDVTPAYERMIECLRKNNEVERAEKYASRLEQLNRKLKTQPNNE